MIDTLKTILELVYFVSGPIIAILAAIGLWQIKVAKDNIRIESKRNALSLSAQQCDHYHRVITPLQDKLDKSIKEKDITYLANAKVTVEADKVKVGFNPPANYIEQVEKIGPEILSVLNAMDAFSIYFATGVADERAAFSSLGRAFCESTKDLLPEIVPHLEDGHFRNLMKLFLLWNSRFESEKLLREKIQIEERLKKIDNKFISPIGTK